MNELQSARNSVREVHIHDGRVLNCVKSLDIEQDWTFRTATAAGLVDASEATPPEQDLRENWWTIRDQQTTGACVGFATADGVLRWHYVKAGLIAEHEFTAPRFIWMANKETDEITEYPTTFIESAGTQTKRALRIAHRWGCVLEDELPMTGGLFRGTTVSFYTRASTLRIESYFNLGRNLSEWRRWIATRGPILTRLSVDKTFMRAGPGARSRLRRYDALNTLGGHAVALVGYAEDHFIVRNSWGTTWGDKGFAYADDAYAAVAFTEAYGVVVPQRQGAYRSIPRESERTEEPLSEPEFEGITIELREWESDNGKRARQILRKVVGRKANKWRVEPVHPDEPCDYDLLPPFGRDDEVTVSRAWEICHALRNHDDVEFAEPSFNLTQDNDPAVSMAGQHVMSGVDDVEGSLSPKDAAAAGLPVVDPAWRDWSPIFISAREAWTLPPRAAGGGFPAGKKMGEGIRIGHPDSGYRQHLELFNAQVEPRLRILKNLDHDFVDGDLEPMTSDGDHGLATASVIMSWEPKTSGPSPNDEITGVAPRADIVPLRVAKVRPIIPTPVLLRSGMIRLRKAIDYAIKDDVDCHVISISLGWLWNRGVHKAVRRAHKKNVVVCAAAGNQVRFVVVWPAHYRETIAVAACDHAGGKWKPSSRGKRVDVTAPGKGVWKADVSLTVKKSSGTSYSVASTAGIAALWLAHWGRTYLMKEYEDVPLGEVFRYVLKRSCTRPDGWNTKKWGAGIVNARATLEFALPTPAQVKARMRRQDSVDAALQAREMPLLTSIFEDVPETVLRSRLAALTGTNADEVGTQLAEFEDEIAFHIITTPELRDALTAMESNSGDATTLTRGIQLDVDGLSKDIRERFKYLR